MNKPSMILPVILVFSIVIGTITGCTTSNGEETKKLSAIEVGEYIGQAVNLDDMKKGDLNRLDRLYQIDAESVEDYLLFTAVSNVKADELLIIKVREEKNLDFVLARIEQRIDAQLDKFRDYRPEEYYLTQKHVLKRTGRLILFAVSEEADQIEQTFDEALR
ncbi:DUF4358 domain-containing protein [Paenibacillus sp. ClWae2A]|uniref:DUF4358 domain-containing protein n=1 Tax=Paenibacillus sp. ClWae2A TaxID=3057177 RepID=UPI0028F5EC93|nr:DUF4358 domain-containing protein [Paenibacillus sp. ClWae2A]MDT9717885.1 DUF4358 domain-containing protein [Paenibacillus sp. ClWae2A]